MTLKIYKIDSSAPNRAVFMTAEALKLNYETQDVSLIAEEHKKPEYLKKNPAHTVPMIEEDDFTLADSHAIIAYLVSKYGDEEQKKLYPSDLRIRATIDHMLHFEGTTLTNASRPIVYGIYRGEQKAPTPQQIEDVNACYEILEKYLEKRKFLACDHVTIADISCVSNISSTETLVPVGDKFPKMQAWLKTLKKEDWYKKGNLPGLAVFKAVMEEKMKN